MKNAALFLDYEDTAIKLESNSKKIKLIAERLLDVVNENIENVTPAEQLAIYQQKIAELSTLADMVNDYAVEYIAISDEANNNLKQCKEQEN